LLRDLIYWTVCGQCSMERQRMLRRWIELNCWFRLHAAGVN